MSLIKLSNALRLICLAILFAGSAATVFAAVSLIVAAEAHGVPKLQAAAVNSPIFINFSKVALVSSILLVICESYSLFAQKRSGKLVLARSIASFLCAAFTFVFALVIVPPMEHDLAIMNTDEPAHQDFDRLHGISQKVFGGTILFALISLVIPAFGDSGNLRIELEEIILAEAKRPKS